MRTLDAEDPKDHALGLRICELAGINPSNVSADNFTIYRNHITYHELSRTINKRTGMLVRKRRIIRNPLPASATNPKPHP